MPVGVVLSVLGAASYGLIACGNDEATGATPTPDAGTEAGDDSGSNIDATATIPRSPSGSRPASVACSAAPRSPGNVVDAGADAECSRDDDCDAGTEGRCGLRRVDQQTAPACTYHACAADDDCPGTTSVCGCGVGWAGQNLCLTRSSCRTDGDCATGQRCVYSDPPILRYFDSVAQGDEVETRANYAGDALGYFCTTPEDDCNCPHDTSTDKCIYNVESKHWQCAYQP